MRWNSGFPLYPKAIEELDHWINLLKFSHVFSYKRSLFCGIANFSMTDIGWTAALDPIQVAVGRRAGGSQWNSLGVHLGDSIGIEHKPLVIWWSNGVNTLPTMLVKGWVSLVWVICCHQATFEYTLCSPLTWSLILWPWIPWIRTLFPFWSQCPRLHHSYFITNEYSTRNQGFKSVVPILSRSRLVSKDHWKLCCGG